MKFAPGGSQKCSHKNRKNIKRKSESMQVGGNSLQDRIIIGDEVSQLRAGVKIEVHGVVTNSSSKEFKSQPSAAKVMHTSFGTGKG